MEKIKYFSCFSGIGGFELGITNAGKQTGTKTECVGYSEVDRFAISVYEKHFKGIKNYGDITKIKTKELPKFDCLVGGFCCQSHSIVGKRKGLEDPKGQVVFDIFRIIKAKKPRFIVLENVKGLLSSNNGIAFKRIITELDELGYNLQWQVLDSSYFGTPQHRERIIIFGSIRGKTQPKIFPFTHFTTKTALKDKWIVSHTNRRTKVDVHNYVNTITASYHGPNGDGAPGVLVGNKIRRLTPLECERLQKFPDNWTRCGKDDELISDSQRYHQCGNAVCVTVIESVFKKLFEQMEELK